MKIAPYSISILRLLFIISVILVGHVGTARSASFDLIWDSLGAVTYTSPNAISSDGTTVVGELRTSAGAEAFIWDATRGLRGLGDLQGGPGISIASGVSGDGSVVAGFSTSDSGIGAFIWDERRGMRELGPLPEGIATTIVGGLSEDGSTVVGTMYSADERRSDAFYWNETVGYRSIGTLPDGTPTYGGSSDTNRDGSVVVGGAANQAFVWTESDGLILLGDLRPTPGPPNSVAKAVTRDGLIVVGNGYGASPFIWDAEGGMRALATVPPGIFNSAAYAASADASVVVGQASTDRGSEAMIWTESGGMELLSVTLSTMGIDLDGWSLFDATGVSADGRTIIGNATKRGFETRAYIAVIPEPGTSILMLLGLSGLAATRRRSSGCPRGKSAIDQL